MLLLLLLCIVSSARGRRCGEIGRSCGSQGVCEVGYAGIDAVCFLKEGVYAVEVEVAVDHGLGVVFLQADVEVCCYVGHDVGLKNFPRVSFS